ncbi:hypothetical protein NL676_028632 [Syzygium grande]|nr:hypothetical protein NL676_028632 [Syzygium grande]
MKFEYLICYINKRLRCRSPSCRKPYVAIEIPPAPIDGNNSKALSEVQQYPDMANASVRGQISATNAGVFVPVFRHWKRCHEETAAAAREECLEMIQMSKKALSRGVGAGNMSGSQKGRLQHRRRVNFSSINQFNNLRNLSLTKTRNMFIHKAKKEIFKKLDEWRS